MLFLSSFRLGPGPGSTAVIVESSLSASLPSELEIPFRLNEGNSPKGEVVLWLVFRRWRCRFGVDVGGGGLGDARQLVVRPVRHVRAGAGAVRARCATAL